MNRDTGTSVIKVKGEQILPMTTTETKAHTTVTQSDSKTSHGNQRYANTDQQSDILSVDAFNGGDEQEISHQQVPFYLKN